MTYDEPQADDEWTDWVRPVMKGYKMGCCDCGLVHDLDFRVVEITKRFRDGRKEGTVLPSKKFQVEFRVRRNERSTGQVRRHMK